MNMQVVKMPILLKEMNICALHMMQTYYVYFKPHLFIFYVAQNTYHTLSGMFVFDIIYFIENCTAISIPFYFVRRTLLPHKKQHFIESE